MMRTQKRSLFLAYYVIIAGLLLASPAWGAQVAAKRNGVKVLDGPSKKAAVLTKLKKGEALESKERKGMYWEVVYQGKTAYVSVLKVKRQAAQSNSLAKAIRDVAKGGRSSDDVAGARSRSAVMGVRGLAEDDETKFAGNARPNLRAVYAMEDTFVTEAKVEALGESVFAEIESRSQ